MMLELHCECNAWMSSLLPRSLSICIPSYLLIEDLLFPLLLASLCWI